MLASQEPGQSQPSLGVGLMLPYTSLLYPDSLSLWGLPLCPFLPFASSQLFSLLNQRR